MTQTNGKIYHVHGFLTDNDNTVKSDLFFIELEQMNIKFVWKDERP